MLQDIQLVLRVGQLVGDIGQHKAAAAHRQVDALDRVENDARIAVDDDQVAVHAHDFTDDAQPLLLAQLVDAVKVQKQHAVTAGLPQAHQLAAAETLAQQHTEHRRLRGIFRRFDAEVDARRIGARGEQQLARALVGAKHQHQLVAVGLINLTDARPQGGVLYFLFDMP